MSTKQGIYSPLKIDQREIRLLRILPTSTDKILRAEFVIESLKQAPCYHAVSYEWNGTPIEQPQATAPLLLVDEVVILVKYNLFYFLQLLRNHRDAMHAPQTLVWADSICINQADLTERGQQVSIMGEIYSQASNVFAWLGTDDSGSSEHLLELVRQTHKYRDGENLSEQWIERTVEDEPFSSTWRALTSCGFWTRAWIVQELVLPSLPVLCWGDVLIPLDELKLLWSDLYQFLESRIQHSNYMADLDARTKLREIGHMRAFGNLLRRRNQYHSGDLGTGNLAYVMLQNSQTLASDGRDYVYSTLGISNPFASGTLKVSYEETEAETFCRATRYMIEGMDRLHLLRLSSGLSSPEMPSWVPNWSRRSYRTRLGSDSDDLASPSIRTDHDRIVDHHRVTDRESALNAGGDLPRNLCFSADGMELHTDAIIVGKIDDVVSINPTNVQSVLFATEGGMPEPFMQLLGPECLRVLKFFLSDLLEYVDRPFVQFMPQSNSPIPMDIRQAIVGLFSILLGVCYDTMVLSKVPGEDSTTLPRQNFVNFGVHLFIRDENPGLDLLGPLTLDQAPVIIGALESDMAIKSFAKCTLLPALAKYDHIIPLEVLRRTALYFDRRVIFSMKQHFACVGHKAEAGDVIAVVYACPTPMVLRPAAARTEIVGRKNYKIVCETWINDLMHCENLPPGLPVQRITIT